VDDRDCGRVSFIKRRDPSTDGLEIGLRAEEGVELRKGALEKSIEEVRRTEGQVDCVFRSELIDEGICLESLA
jgi:hypothetical protein